MDSRPETDEISKRGARPDGSAARSRNLGGFLVLAAILTGLIPLKIATKAGDGPYGLDANYYVQIARSVAEGGGLMTHVSLYHEGLNPLPAPARIYPLWPLVLGTTGAAIGLTDAVNILPPVLWVVALIFLYILSQRIAFAMDPISHGRIAGERLPLTAGHLVVAAFATNPIFWWATSHPYTEGLAFTLAFGALLVLDTAIRRTSSAVAVSAGALAGLAFLARSQMVIIIAAAILVLLIASFRWAPMRKIGAAAVLGFGIVAAGWIAYRAMRPIGTTDVGGFATWVNSPTAGAYLADRLPGLAIAFDPRSSLSYFNSFGPTVLVIFFAIAWLAVESGRRGRFPRLEPQYLLAVMAIATALLSHGILVHRHARFFLPWLFGWRHGLPLIFGLSAAIVYLVTRPSALTRWGVVVLVAFATLTGTLRIDASENPTGMTNAEAAFARWVDHQTPPPTMLTIGAQTLGMLTRGRYHWMSCDESPAQTGRMLESLPIDYVVVYGSARHCRFLDGLGGILKVEHSFGPPEHERIWLLRPRAATRVRPNDPGGNAY
ncbi:MAG: hypothetical protein ABR517_05140 [Thermoanaerobaculia bacterium]